MKALHWFAIHRDNMISIPEASFLGDRASNNAITCIFCREVFLSPITENVGINAAGDNQIHDNPAEHDEEALICFFGSILPGLGRFGQLILIHALIYHPGNLHVSSKREPSQSKLGVP